MSGPSVVVVNGGARGIGEAICRGFAADGARVAVLDIDGDAARRLAAQLPDSVGIGCDIADQAQVDAAFERVQELGRLVTLVNNAGINPRRAPLELDAATWYRVLNVNLTGYLFCALAAGRRMVPDRSGTIINVSSIAGSTALGRGNLAYAVTKGGIDALTRELAIEWARHGVRVNAVAPCQVSTEGYLASEQARIASDDAAAMDYRRGLPLGRMAYPTDIADAVRFLASDAASMITGAVLPVDGGNLAMNAGGTLG